VVATKANSTTVVPRQYLGTLSAILMLYPSQRGELSRRDAGWRATGTALLGARDHAGRACKMTKMTLDRGGRQRAGRGAHGLWDRWRGDDDVSTLGTRMGPRGGSGTDPAIAPSIWLLEGSRPRTAGSVRAHCGHSCSEPSEHRLV
jgi:hypothetical protein